MLCSRPALVKSTRRMAEYPVGPGGVGQRNCRKSRKSTTIRWPTISFERRFKKAEVEHEQETRRQAKNARWKLEQDAQMAAITGQGV